MKCNACGKEMREAESCREPRDTTNLPPAKFHHMLRKCPDCGVHPGGYHHPGCDTEKCGACRRQALSCKCGPEDYWAHRRPWIGIPEGYQACFNRGWFCRDMAPDGPLRDFGLLYGPNAIYRHNQIRWHVPCGPDDPGAHPDLNRWASAGRPSE
jgi:hypothetical protein